MTAFAPGPGRKPDGPTHPWPTRPVTDPPPPPPPPSPVETALADAVDAALDAAFGPVSRWWVGQVAGLGVMRLPLP